MTQEALQLQTTPPYPGGKMVDDVNKALATLVSCSAGDSEPVNPYPNQWWAHAASGWLKQRNAENSGWINRFKLADAMSEVGAALFSAVSASAARAALGVSSDSTDLFYKPDYDSVAFVKTGPNSLAVKAGVGVALGMQVKGFTTQTAIAMPTLVAGTDYSIWVSPDGTAQAVKDTFAARASAPVAGARKIGGFHYGLVAPGTTVVSGSFSTSGVTGAGGSMAWSQADVDKIAGINAYSLWDLAWRVDGEQYGMSYDPLKNEWCGIYFMSTAPHIYGASAYNTDVASGTVLPYVPPEWGGNGVLKYSALNVFVANELLSAHNLRLPTYDSAMSFFFGVTEGQSLGGASVTIPATGRAPGYTSRIGIEQATGHQWTFGGPIVSSNGSAFASNGRGEWYGSSGAVLLSGSRVMAVISGSMAVDFSVSLSRSAWDYSVRAAGDHLKRGVPAR